MRKAQPCVGFCQGIVLRKVAEAFAFLYALDSYLKLLCVKRFFIDFDSIVFVCWCFKFMIYKVFLFLVIGVYLLSSTHEGT